MSGDILNRKPKIVFYQILGIGILSFTFLSLLIVGFFPKFVLIWNYLLGKLEESCGCTHHLSFSNHPFLFIFLILLGSSLIFFLIFIIIKIVKLKSATDKFIKTNLKNKKENLSPKLKKAAGLIGLANQIIEINEEKPVVFSYGFLKSKICISGGIIRRLSKAELVAVLLHEKHHLQAHEPRKLFLIKLISKIFFFIPGLKSLVEKYLVFSELNADYLATNGFHNKVSLVQALYKLMKWKKQLIFKNNLAIPFLGATEERINILLDDEYIPKLKILSPGLLISFFLLLLSLILFNFAIRSTNSALASYEGGSCQLESYHPQNQCTMKAKNYTCLMTYGSKDNSCSVKP